jgi:hypothetical protein
VDVNHHRLLLSALLPLPISPSSPSIKRKKNTLNDPHAQFFSSVDLLASESSFFSPSLIFARCLKLRGGSVRTSQGLEVVVIAAAADVHTCLMQHHQLGAE